MERSAHSWHIRNGMTMFCIAVFLFSYVNSSMFWHGHNVSGSWIVHSHISGKAHRSAPAENSHTTAEYQLIESLNQTSVTEDVIASYDLAPSCRLVFTVLVLPELAALAPEAAHISLRGPPALV